MKKGQFAMEYFLVVGFSLVIITPMIFLLYSEYGSTRTEVQYEHLVELSREIIFQAEKLYYQGPPSQTTMQAYFPPGIINMTIFNGTGGEEDIRGVYLEFAIEDSPGLVSLWSKVPIKIDDNFKPFQGLHVLVLQVKRDSTGQYVLISEKDQ